MLVIPLTNPRTVVTLASSSTVAAAISAAASCFAGDLSRNPCALLPCSRCPAVYSDTATQYVSAAVQPYTRTLSRSTCFTGTKVQILTCFTGTNAQILRAAALLQPYILGGCHAVYSIRLYLYFCAGHLLRKEALCLVMILLLGLQ